ncbi:MAG: oligosaccharide flippase family protein [bacterium]|nr:oligosaccharide flippase family protein [bacterium]
MPKLSLSDKAVIIFLGEFIEKMMAILIGIILVRVFTKSDYGSYRQVWLVVGTFSMISLMGIPKSVFYFIPKLDDQKRKGFILQTIILLFLIGSILTLILYLFSSFIGSRFNNPSLVKLLKIFSLYPMFSIPIQYLRNLLISLDKHKMAAIFPLLKEVIFLIFVLVPAILGYPLVTVFISVLIFSFLTLIIVLLYTFTILFGKLRFDGIFSTLRPQIGYSIPLGLSGILEKISRELDKFVISFFYLSDRFAIYSIGAIQIPLVTTLRSSIGSVLLPKLVELYDQEKTKGFIKLWHESIRKTAIIVLPIFAFLFVTAEQFITFLYTNDYLESTGPFRIYLFSIPYRVTNFGYILMAMGYSKFILIGSIIFILSNLLLNIFFIHLIGFLGPALATIIASYILNGFFLIKTKGMLHLSLLELFPWMDMLKILSVSGLSSCLIYPLTLLQIPSFLVLVLAALIYIPTYILLLNRLDMITESDILLVKRWLGLGIFFRG